MWLYHPIVGYMDSIDDSIRDGISKVMREKVAVYGCLVWIVSVDS
jgi:hypothetical protein